MCRVAFCIVVLAIEQVTNMPTPIGGENAPRPCDDEDDAVLHGVDPERRRHRQQQRPEDEEGRQAFQQRAHADERHDREEWGRAVQHGNEGRDLLRDLGQG